MNCIRCFALLAFLGACTSTGTDDVTVDSLSDEMQMDKVFEDEEGAEAEEEEKLQEADDGDEAHVDHESSLVDEDGDESEQDVDKDEDEDENEIEEFLMAADADANEDEDGDGDEDEDEDEETKLGDIHFGPDVPLQNLRGKQDVVGAIKNQRKPGMVIVTKDGCPMCIGLSGEINGDAQAKSMMQNFIVIHAADGEGEEWNGAEDHYVPRVYWIDTEGNYINVTPVHPNPGYAHFFWKADHVKNAMTRILR